MSSQHEIDFCAWTYDLERDQFRDDPPPLFERTQDDITRDIRNWSGPVIPPLGLDDEGAAK